MNRTLTVAITSAAMMGAMTGLAPSASATDQRPALLLKVNSVGWGARVNRDRYAYVYGYDRVPEFYGDDEGGYGDGYGHRYRRPVQVAPYGHGDQFDDDQF